MHHMRQIHTNLANVPHGASTIFPSNTLPNEWYQKEANREGHRVRTPPVN